MITKADLKYYSQLLQKKYRISEKKFIIEGEKLLNEALASGLNCEVVFMTNSFVEKKTPVLSELKKKNIRIEILKQVDFNQLVDTQTPQGIAGIFYMKKMHIGGNEKTLPPVIVALERISDPGNLGTIIRNCDWFGFDFILVGEDCAEIYNPKVIRASMGSVFHVDFFDNVNLYKKAEEYIPKGYDTVVADLEGTPISKFIPAKKTIVFFCNEAAGPSPELLGIVKKKITIPRYGKAESLNVSTASSVILNSLREKIPI
ncbi:MAG TPA: RNA methyltransferase [Ignavibacteriaceae bacterium]|jgi:TrmH family RNA methyltransferase|nr:RNA methyltransferase [Ignavibacteriaceae bacterium]